MAMNSEICFPQIQEYIASTTNLNPELIDGLLRNNPFMQKIKDMGAYETFKGGTFIERLYLADPGVAPTNYYGAELWPVQDIQPLHNWLYEFVQKVLPITFNAREDFTNSGEAKRVDLWEVKFKAVIKTLNNSVNYDLVSDGSEYEQMGGLQFLFPDDPKVGHIGGYDRATTPQTWHVAVGVPAASITPATIQSYMGTMVNRLTRNGERPNLIVTDDNLYEMFVESLTEVQRFADSKSADAGFQTVFFRGIPVITIGGWQGIGLPEDSIPLGGAPENHMYFLNMDYIRLMVAEGYDFKCGEPRLAINQDNIIVPVYWWGQLVCDLFFLQGVLYLT